MNNQTPCKNCGKNYKTEDDCDGEDYYCWECGLEMDFEKYGEE